MLDIGVGVGKLGNTSMECTVVNGRLISVLISGQVAFLQFSNFAFLSSSSQVRTSDSECGSGVAFLGRSCLRCGLIWMARAAAKTRAAARNRFGLFFSGSGRETDSSFVIVFADSDVAATVRVPRAHVACNFSARPAIGPWRESQKGQNLQDQL
jgi:hypothetical protein